MKHPLDTRVVEQGLVQLDTGKRGREQVVGPAADPVGDQPGDLVGLVPLLGLIVPADGRSDDDPGERNELALGDFVDRATRRHQQDVAG